MKIPNSSRFQGLTPSLIILLALGAATALSGCSVVFSASLSGSIHDQAQYDSDTGASGIADAEIYLYSEKKERNADRSKWKSSGKTPKKQSGHDYYQVTVTDTQGGYTFNGYRWEDLFPDFGKSGDRREIYMLIYHEDYGLRSNPSPIFAVSDVTTSIPPIKLSSLYSHTDLEGSVEETNTADPVAGAAVRVYISREGTALEDYPESPSYTLTTNAEGQYRQRIRFLPPAAARITFDLNGYIPDESDPDLHQADGTNLDGNTIDGTSSPGDGTGNTYVDVNHNREFDDGDIYLQTNTFSANTIYHANTVALKQTEFSEELNGRVIDGGGTGQNDVIVWLFIWEDTDNDGTDETTCTADASPNRNTYTASRLVGDTPEPGYFTFPNITWSDEDYTGSSSTKKVTVYLPTAAEISDGSLSGGPSGTEKEYTMQSGQNNFVVVTQ